MALILILLAIAPSLPAQDISEEEYRSRLAYQREKLELLTKKRFIAERRKTTTTDIDFVTYTWEAYTFTEGDIETETVARAEKREITEWYIRKGGLRELSDFEFLALVKDEETLSRILEIENQKSGMRKIGNLAIGAGLLAMIGGAAFSAEKVVISSGAVATTIGFFISAFNQTPAHYIQPDYAMEKIDEYNINLKKELNLPLDYD